MPRPVADALLDVIRDWGVRHLFTCPGSTEAPVLDALVVRDDVELVLTTHESVTVSMADGLSRATRTPSVAYLHTNVGLTNGLSNLHAAQLAYSPVVVLNGLKASSIQARGGFTTGRRIRDHVHQYVKSDWQSLTATAVPEDVNRAFRLAVTEPAGPVWVGLSQDLLESDDEAPVPQVPGFRFDSRTQPSAEAVRQAATLLRTAERPVLVAGSDIARVGAVAQLVELSERIGAPVLHEERRSYERPGFPASHPHFRGRYDVRHPLVREADVVFFVGARVFNEFETATEPGVPRGARLIHSHADACHVAQIYGVDVGLVGDQQLLLEALCGMLSPTDREPASPPAETEQRRPSALPSGALAASDVVEVVTDSLRGAALVGDATTSGGRLLEHAQQDSPDDFFTSSSGSLGWGMGAALGIKMGMPDRPVAAILGDGVFQFGVPALWTAAHSSIPVVFVVINNERYAAVAAALRRFGGNAVAKNDYPGTDIAGPRIADVSTAFGVPGRRVSTLGELRDCLASMRGLDHPSLVEVMTDPTDFGP